MGFLKAFDAVAEKIILDAMENGEFDNIKGKGKPLNLDDDSNIPPDLRMGYKILKNSGHLPPEIEQEREIKSVKDLLANCRDERERYRQMQKLNYLILKANMQRKRPIALEKSQYYDKAANRVSVRPENPQPAPPPKTSQTIYATPVQPDMPGKRFSLMTWIREQWRRVY
jgi:hypothetical protein